MVDWLEKAASNELLNNDQGWEPMRNDHNTGFMLYDIYEVIDAYKQNNSSCLIRSIDYETRKSRLVTGSLCDSNKKKTAHSIFFLAPNLVRTYIPNSITNLKQLYEYSKSIGLKVKESLKIIDEQHRDEDLVFIVLSVKRPINVIGSTTNIEFLNFVIYKEGKRKKQKSRILPDCKVGMLTHIADRSPKLFRYLSGTRTKINETENIALIGCGSLGSKIGMHLARNGNGPFICIDDDIFLPHNNARHALTLTWAQNKAELLALSMYATSRVLAQGVREKAFKADFSKSRLIIDTTASLSVKSFLMENVSLPPVISCGLFGHGRYGLMFVENKNKTIRLTDIWANLYLISLTNVTFQKVLFDSNYDQALIGQSCSSQTMIIDDTRISIFSSVMALRIQKLLEEGLPNTGEIFFSIYDDQYSLKTEKYNVPNSILLKSIKANSWQAYISEDVSNDMKQLLKRKAPCETGGVLIGTVFFVC